MVNRNTPLAARNTENTGNNFSLNASERFTPLSTKKSADLAANDDLIRSLSDAYENKRARQVFEWERARRLAPPAMIV